MVRYDRKPNDSHAPRSRHLQDVDRRTCICWMEMSQGRVLNPFCFAGNPRAISIGTGLSFSQGFYKITSLCAPNIVHQSLTVARFHPSANHPVLGDSTVSNTQNSTVKIIFDQLVGRNMSDTDRCANVTAANNQHTTSRET